MIPIPGNFIPKSIKDSWKIRALVALLTIVIAAAILFFQLRQSAREFVEGPRFDEMETRIALHLFDSIAIGLNAYRAERGHYPIVEGKYFFDSVKQYIPVQEVYIYADTVDSLGTFIPIRKQVGRRFEYRSRSHTYIAVGRSQLSIVYRPSTPDSYLLYWVGENGIDEGGSGDDLVFRH
jgi:hypothetical protein